MYEIEMRMPISLIKILIPLNNTLNGRMYLSRDKLKQVFFFNLMHI